MYSIDFISLESFSILEHDWDLLQRGKDMTYFQQYVWYKILAELNKEIKNKNIEYCFARVKKEGKTNLIAPLWIVKNTFAKFNKKGVYIFGRAQWSDYLNFIYDEFDSASLDFLFNQIKKKYGISNYILEDIRQNSDLAQYIINKFHLKNIEQSICVGLNIPDSEDEYKMMLSKSAKQNIRTAFNRAKTDGISFIFDFDDKSVNLDEFERFRNIRLLDKNQYHQNIISRLQCFISSKILRRGYYKFPEYTPYRHDINSKFLTIKSTEGELCAAFNYGLDKARSQIVLMAVSTNPKYYKYSPGILVLYEYIINEINYRDIKSIDFTRGNERYKYVLGGKEHYNVKLEFDIN